MARRLMFVCLAILALSATACSKKKSGGWADLSRFWGGGGDLPNEDGSSGGGQGHVTTITPSQFPNQRQFSGVPGFPTFPSSANRYMIGFGLTMGGGGRCKRMDYLARPIYADASLGNLINFKNCEDKSQSGAPPGGWDFAYYNEYSESDKPNPYFRVITGISVSSVITGASFIARTFEPGMHVSEAEYVSTTNPWYNLTYITVPDFSYNEPGQPRVFFVPVGLYFAGSPDGTYDIAQVEIKTAELHFNQGYGFKLINPETKVCLGRSGEFPQPKNIKTVLVDNAKTVQFAQNK